MTERGLLKVGDFGTSRFLEIAAHGTTVIGSPPYMAPEQFEGRAVFASDLYSLGVTMYQMLTGTLPYDTPAPCDLERLRRGDLVSPPARRATRHPAGHRRHRDAGASRPTSSARYQRAEDLLTDILNARRRARPARAGGRAGAGGAPSGSRPVAARRRRPSRTARAKSARAASAGTAASRCPHGAGAARSVAKRSKTGNIELPVAASAARPVPSGVSMAFNGTGKVWMNGKIVDWADANIHIASHVVHYGSAVFEGARCYKTPKGSAFFRLDAHMRRLYDSARIYRMDYGLDRDAFTRGVVETVKANGLEACYIRPILYRGYNELGVNPLPCPVDAAILVWEWGAYLGTGSARAGRGRLRQLLGAQRAEHVPGDGEVRRQLRQLGA